MERFTDGIRFYCPVCIYLVAIRSLSFCPRHGKERKGSRYCTSMCTFTVTFESAMLQVVQVGKILETQWEEETNLNLVLDLASRALLCLPVGKSPNSLHEGSAAVVAARFLTLTGSMKVLDGGQEHLCRVRCSLLLLCWVANPYQTVMGWQHLMRCRVAQSPTAWRLESCCIPNSCCVVGQDVW